VANAHGDLAHRVNVDAQPEALVPDQVGLKGVQVHGFTQLPG